MWEIVGSFSLGESLIVFRRSIENLDLPDLEHQPIATQDSLIRNWNKLRKMKNFRKYHLFFLFCANGSRETIFFQRKDFKLEQSN